MRHITTLIRILNEAGFEVQNEEEITKLMWWRSGRLFKANEEFRKFLIRHTDFLPVDTLPRERWKYYVANKTEIHTCYACGKIASITKKYCSHQCSTTVSEGLKRGPHFDLNEKRKDFDARLEKRFRSLESTEECQFELVEFNYPRSKFRHTCGEICDIENRRVLENTAKCKCSYKRVMVHDIESLRARYEELNSVWEPIKIIKVGQARFRNKQCGHEQEFSTQVWKIPCTTCLPSVYSIRTISHEEYVARLARNFPEFKVVGTYVNVKEELEYKHLVCGKTFKTIPNTFARYHFRCPICFPSSSSKREVVVQGKTFSVQGREGTALNWIVAHTTIKAADIKTGKGVPKFRYYSEVDAKWRTYYPDFWIKKRNLIIEVKDKVSSGISGSHAFNCSAEELWGLLRAKAKAVKNEGYKFRVLIFKDRKTRIKLPKDWINYSYADIRSWYIDYLTTS